MEQRRRRQVMKTVQQYERHSRLGQSWESLPERVRQHLLRCDEQLVAVLRDDPHTAHLGAGGHCWKVTSWHSSAQALGRIQRFSIAGTWMKRTVDCERPLWPHVSEESLVLKVLERLRFLKGPLLVECGWSFFSTRNCEDETSPDVDTHKFPSSHRRQHGATEILSSHMDLSTCTVHSFGTVAGCSTINTRCGLVGARFGGTVAARKDWDRCCLRMATYLVLDCVAIKFSRGERFLVVSDSLVRACEFWLMGPDLLVTNKKD